MFLPLMKRKLLASYRSPETKKIPADLFDKNGYWTGYYVNPYTLGYNTKWVKKDEVPKTYEELLNPKWKGQKISVDNTSYNLLAGLITAWGRTRQLLTSGNSPPRSHPSCAATPTESSSPRPENSR